MPKFFVELEHRMTNEFSIKVDADTEEEARALIEKELPACKNDPQAVARLYQGFWGTKEESITVQGVKLRYPK